jgi:hypothetical protein
VPEKGHKRGSVPCRNSVRPGNQQLAKFPQPGRLLYLWLMFRFVSLWFGTLVRLFRSRSGLVLENLALRQQLTAFKRRHPKPKLGVLDQLFLGRRSPILVSMETVAPPRHARDRDRCPLGTALDSDCTGPGCAKPETQ